MPKSILVLSMLVITLLFTSCNDGGSAEAEKTSADSAAIADSSAIVPLPDSVDSNIHVDSAAAPNNSNTGDPTRKTPRRYAIKPESDSSAEVRK